MPLHLLSKKSWNVYAPANRARVARDEALAEAAEQDAQQLKGDQASSAILDRLRYDANHGPSRQSTEQDRLLLKATKNLSSSTRYDRKRKRLPGEDKTDQEIREARGREHERQNQLSRAYRLPTGKMEDKQQTHGDLSLVDKKGHINLFGDEEGRSTQPESKTRLQKQKEQHRDSDQAAGVSLREAINNRGSKGTWYLDKDGTVKDDAGRDVWGNEDPRRKQRHVQRLTLADPLAFMNQAQSRLEAANRARELKHEHEREDDELSKFSLDTVEIYHHSREPRNRRDTEQRRHRHHSHRPTHTRPPTNYTELANKKWQVDARSKPR